MKVWLVYEGDNYDNSLVAVVSSEEKAKEYTRVWPYETYIEEHEVDEDSDFPPGLLPYGVSYEKDKEYVHRCHPDTPEESTHHNGNILIRVWAENEQHASILARSKYLDLLSRRFIWQQLGDLHWGACPPAHTRSISNATVGRNSHSSCRYFRTATDWRFTLRITPRSMKREIRVGRYGRKP